MLPITTKHFFARARGYHGENVPWEARGQRKKRYNRQRFGKLFGLYLLISVNVFIHSTLPRVGNPIPRTVGTKIGLWSRPLINCQDFRLFIKTERKVFSHGERIDKGLIWGPEQGWLGWLGWASSCPPTLSFLQIPMWLMWEPGRLATKFFSRLKNNLLATEGKIALINIHTNNRCKFPTLSMYIAA